MSKVLVVDDNMQVLLSLTRLLEENGHEVIPAKDGPTTLSAVIFNTPDIVVLDNGLPGVSGLDLCVAIKHMPDHQNLPIIVLTTARRQFDDLLANRLGVEEYLQKPVDPQTLLDLVTKYTVNKTASRVPALNVGIASAN